MMQGVAFLSLILGYLLLLALAVRHRVGRGRLHHLLEVQLILTPVWTAGLGLLAILAWGGWWAFAQRRLAQLGLVVLAAWAVEFGDAFLGRPSRRRFRLGLVALLTAAAIILDLLPGRLLVRLAPGLLGQIGSIRLSGWLLGGGWLFSSGIAWWTAVVALRRTTGARHRNRLRYLLLALFAWGVGDLLILLDGMPDLYIGLAARLLGFGLATLAVLRYHLPDVRRLGLLTIRLLLLCGLTAAVYLAAVLIGAYLAGTLPALFRSAAAGGILGLALLIGVLADVTLSPHLRRLLDRAFLDQERDMQKALRAYSQQVGLILDVERLADVTLEWLGTAMRVKRSALVLFTPQADGRVELKVLRGRAISLPPARLFSADNRFIVHFRNIRRPLSQYDVDMLAWFQTMPADERQWLQELAVDLWVPVLVANQPAALLALGPKAGGQPYSDEDLETLTILAAQVGTALQNARLVDDLRGVQDEIHRLNTELGETNRQLKRLEQTKADFITIASHELRTPLSQIYGYSDILASLPSEELSDAEVVHQFVEGISRGAGRLKRVVDAMVDLSLIESGSLVLRPVSMSVKVIVQNAVGTVQPAAERRNQTIVVHDLSRLPYIEVDGPRLEQVLTSLLNNAVKFTPDGGQITVSGRTGYSPTGEAYIELLVADNGIGIDPDQRELIFDKFYRAENPMQHSSDDVGFKGAGPGLGLAIAKGIVEAHGGRIWVESPGRNEATCPGSTFHVRLPVSRPARGSAGA